MPCSACSSGGCMAAGTLWTRMPRARTGGGDEEVVGLDVAVQDPVAVADIQRAQQHLHVALHVRLRQDQRAVLYQRLQVALHVLKHLH